MIVHPDDLDYLYKKSVEMIETGESEPFSYRFIRRDGSVARVLYRQCNLPGIDGRPVTPVSYTHRDVYKRQIDECQRQANRRQRPVAVGKRSQRAQTINRWR